MEESEELELELFEKKFLKFIIDVGMGFLWVL